MSSGFVALAVVYGVVVSLGAFYIVYRLLRGLFYDIPAEMEAEREMRDAERAQARREAAGSLTQAQARRCRSCGAAEGEYHDPDRCTDQAALLPQAIDPTR